MLPALQRRVNNNINLQPVFGGLTLAQFNRIMLNLNTLQAPQMEALLFRLTPDRLAPAAVGVAVAVHDLFENFRNGGVNPRLTALELQTLIMQHGGTLGPGAVELRTRLEALRVQLMPNPGDLTGAQLITLVTQMAAAGGQAIVDTVTTLRHAGMGLAPTPAAVFNRIIAMRTPSGTVPAMNAIQVAAIVRRLQDLDGADLVATIQRLGDPAIGWIHMNYAVTPIEYLSWRALGVRVAAHNWTPQETVNTLTALRAAGANTITLLSTLVQALTPFNWTAQEIAATVGALHAAGATTVPRIVTVVQALGVAAADGTRLAPARIQALAAAVNNYDELNWAAAGSYGPPAAPVQFPKAYDDALAAGRTAAEIATVIHEAYTSGRAEAMTSNHLTQLLTIAAARNRPAVRIRRFVQWVAAAHHDDNAVSWTDSMARIADFAADYTGAPPALPPAIREHVNLDRLNVRDEDMRHYLYGHTYGWFVFTRLNLRRAANGYLSFWPQGFTVLNVQNDARAMIQHDDVQALMGGLGIGGAGNAATVDNRRVTVVRRAAHQYDLVQLYPTGGLGVRELQWRVVTSIGMFLGYMNEEAPFNVVLDLLP